jgi:acyl-CoA reductase-like NAD-dependent aldehyde dehydrogenase
MSDTVSRAAEENVLRSVPRQLLVGGEWRPAAGGATFAVEDPATGETLVEVADGRAEDARGALDAAVEGAVTAKMRNMGEACTAANRFHVHESASGEFARAWRRGWPGCAPAGAPTPACRWAR